MEKKILGKGNPPIWLPVVLVCAVLVGGGLLVTSIYMNLRHQSVGDQEQLLLALARSAASNLENYLGSYQKDFSVIKASSDFQRGVSAYRREGDDSLLLDYLDTYNYATEDYVADIVLTDHDGNRLTGTNRYGPYEAITPSDGDLVVARSASGRLYLAISTLVDQNYRLQSMVDVAYMYEDTGAFMAIGEKGYVTYKHSSGIVLTHPETSQIGKDVIQNRKELYPDFYFEELEDMVARQKTGAEGIEIYHSYWWAEKDPVLVKKICAYTPARIGSDFLIVSAVADYNEIMDPVNRGIFSIGAVMLVMMICFCLLAVQLYTAIQGKRQVERENFYLRELNTTLEEMRRSEEKIQHFQRLETIGTLTGGIAHELGNLLTPIMAYSALMADELSGQEELYDEAQEIYSAAVKAKEVIQQVTDISRKDRETAFRDLDLTETVEAALKMAYSAKPKTVEMEWDLALDGRHLLGSSTQLCQVVLNLCTNAFHAVRERENGRLDVKGRILPGDKAEITFTDNGTGIERHILDRVFDPFFTTKRTGEGTGLGLSIVQSIMENHQGSVTVESEPGKGTVFTLLLPVGAARPPEKPVHQGGKRRVLLLDEDPRVARMLTGALLAEDYQVESFSRSDEAMSYLRKTAGVNLFICSYHMSHGEGGLAALLARNTQPGIRILVTTGFVDRELVESEHKGIIDGFLVKPVRLTELLEKVRQLLGEDQA
jgi:two-component system cell cycle sensor histidine kinase/response regulator CckA